MSLHFSRFVGGQKVLLQEWPVICDNRFCQLSRHLGFFRLAMYTYLSERRG
jgi:hypothetical protein